ncbi:MAG TPA: hypothetical protein VGE52_22175 [Pirellulales bacterium]
MSTAQNIKNQINSNIREEEGKDLLNDAVTYLREYAQEKPETLALWCFGIGFVLGWKLKPW